MVDDEVVGDLVLALEAKLTTWAGVDGHGHLPAANGTAGRRRTGSDGRRRVGGAHGNGEAHEADQCSQPATLARAGRGAQRRDRGRRTGGEGGRARRPGPWPASRRVARASTASAAHRPPDRLLDQRIGPRHRRRPTRPSGGHVARRSRRPLGHADGRVGSRGVHDPRTRCPPRRGRACRRQRRRHPAVPALVVGTTFGSPRRGRRPRPRWHERGDARRLPRRPSQLRRRRRGRRRRCSGTGPRRAHAA